MGAIFAIGMLGYKVSGPRVGTGSAALLALSPWYLRYTAEARGYAMLILGIVVALLLTIAAIERGKVRWWFLFGLGQAVYMLCFQGAVYVALAINLVVFVTLCMGVGSNEARFTRFFGAGVLSLMVYGGFQTVAAAQTLEMIKGPRLDGSETMMGLNWMRDTLSHIVAGIPWAGDSPIYHHGVSVQQAWDGQPIYEWVVVFVFPLLALFGLMHMTKYDWKARIAVVPESLAVFGAVLHNKLAGNLMFEWSVIYAIIPFALCVAWAADRVAPKHTRTGAWVFIPVLLLYLLVVLEPIQRLRTYDRQPMRQVVEKVRGTGYAATLGSDEGILTATFSTSAGRYSPTIHGCGSPRTVTTLSRSSMRPAQTRRNSSFIFADTNERRKSSPNSILESRHPPISKKLKRSKAWSGPPFTRFINSSDRRCWHSRAVAD